MNKKHRDMYLDALSKVIAAIDVLDDIEAKFIMDGQAGRFSAHLATFVGSADRLPGSGAESGLMAYLNKMEK